MDHISGHKLVSLKIKCPKVKLKSMFKIYRDFKYSDYARFRDDLQIFNFDYVFSCANANSMVSFF